MVTETAAVPPPAPGSPERSEPAYGFDFCGGQLAIDFTNTVGDRGSTRLDHFNTFGDIVAWAEARGVMSRSAAAALRRRAAADQDGAARAWRTAIAFREALYRVLAAAAESRRVRPDDLQIVNDHVTRTFEHVALRPAGGRFSLDTPPRNWLDPVIGPVVRAAIELLTSDALQRVGRCADDECAWLFLDTTRSKTRRWCDMKVCGNRHKVRRFRQS
jgi:predicted RNA-binding Zn ribbon-like protein